MNDELAEIRTMRSLLEQAQELIASRELAFVCTALSEAYERGGQREWSALVRLHAWIRRQIAPCTTYQTWLKCNYTLAWGKFAGEGLRQGRLAWIAHMIEVLNEMEKEHEHQR